MNASNGLNQNKKSMLIDLVMKKLIGLFLFIILIVTVITNMLIVQEDELVVVKQFGRVEKIIAKPGLYFKLPIIENTQILSKKLMNYETQPIKILSKDKKNLAVTNYVLWKISNPKDFIDNAQTAAGAETMIESAVFSAVRQRYGELSFDEIINDSASGIDNNALISEELNKQLNKSGIEIIDTRLKKAYLPVGEEEAAYSRIRSEMEKTAKQYIASAESESAQIKAEADKEAKIILSKASAEAEQIKGKADAEAAKIYAKAYNQDPEFYRFIRTLESYKKTLKGKSTIILPLDSPYTKYLMGK